MKPGITILILLAVLSHSATASTIADREWIVADGSFENGVCNEGSAWTCWSTNDCQWIINAEDVWGVPAYHGEQVAWLGAFCDGVANNNSFCQSMWIACGYYDFYFMTNIIDACGTLSFTFNDNVLFENTMTVDDHNYGTWESISSRWGFIDTYAYYGYNAVVCIEWKACGEDLDGDGWPDTENDSVIIDYVYGEECNPSSVDRQSFSTVKTLY